jgi:murein DD-endopeptidase MepM/ murein hydrolase activator NlpD
MKELLTYLAQVSVLSACGWVVYKALFARDTLHRMRRLVLLVLLAASFAVPVCRITVEREMPAVVTPENMALGGIVSGETPAFIARGEVQSIPESPLPDLWLMAGIVYLMGVGALAAYRLAGVVRVRRIMRRAVERFTRADGVEVLLVGEEIPPFSFGGRIVISQSDFAGDGAEMILRHELAHIRHRHGVDLAVMNAAQAVLWFNPFVWLLRGELVLVHEIAADSEVIQSGIDAKKYQYLLISKVARVRGLLPVASHLPASDLGKRIETMKRKTSRTALLKTVLLLPLVAVALVAFARVEHVATTATAPPPDEPQKEQLATPAGSGSAAPADKPRERTDPLFILSGKPNPKERESLKVTIGRFSKRKHPVTGEEYFHTGIDIIPIGDTVYTPYSGVVTSEKFEEGYGNLLTILHESADLGLDGVDVQLGTSYAHLEKFLVPEGAHVVAGQPIGIVGNTGKSTGKHLHFETRVNGELTDPMETIFKVEK